MKLEQLIRGLMVGGIWIFVAVVLGIGALVMALTGNSLPEIAFWFPVIAAAVLTLLIMTPWGWQLISRQKMADVNQQLEDGLGQLSDAEMLELMQGLDELREHLGIDIDLPLKSKKRKREQVDSALRQLSDTELLHLKDRLRSGEVDETRLLAWLDAQRESKGDA